MHGSREHLRPEKVKIAQRAGPLLVKVQNENP
jgi:hypothetical protein